MDFRFVEYQFEDFEGYYTCLNDYYHGTHPYPRYFRREYLEDSIRKGEMIILLVKNEKDEIIGTSAAQLQHGPFENSVMLGMRYIRVDCQGLGIGKALEIALLEEAKVRFPNAESLYAEVVSNYLVSQATLCQQGFRMTGINMMLYAFYPSIYPEEDYRNCMVTYVRSNTGVPRVIYPPRECRQEIAKIYAELGVDCEQREEAFRNGMLEYELEILAPHSKAQYYITSVGMEIEGMLASMQEQLRLGRTLTAFISMSRPGAQELFCALKSLGFYFCGIKPLNRNQEYLILCQTENHKVGDRRNIQIPPENKEFADKIIQNAMEGIDSHEERHSSETDDANPLD